MEASLRVSKLNSAKRQLEVSVRLYFASDDPVSMHTLASAAYNVLRDVSAKRQSPGMLLKDTLIQMLRPDTQDMFRRKVNEAENFFKHADRDHDASFEFYPGLTEIFLLNACDQYYRLTGETSPLFKLCRGWYAANNPEMLDFSKHFASFQQSAQQIAAMVRGPYFATFLAAVTAMQI